MPIGQNAPERNLKRLGGGQLFGSQACVAAVKFWMAFIGQFQCGRWNIVTTAPDLYLRFAEFFSHFRFI